MVINENSSSMFEDTYSQGCLPSGQDPSYYEIQRNKCNAGRTCGKDTDHQGNMDMGHCGHSHLGCGKFNIGRLDKFVLYFVVIYLFSTVTAKSYQKLESEAANYMMTFGYVPDYTIETQNLMSQEDFTKALKRLQTYAGIPATGIIDYRTEALMLRPRCGVKDREYSDFGRRRRKRYVLAPSKWQKKDLTFRILNYTPDLPRDKIRRAIYDGFKVWSDVTDLTFTEVFSSHADILIQFARSYHKDGYPFDGEGLILAHAFYPGDGKGGDTHFDDDEHWTFNSSEKGVDLFMVAAHEFGHALGLGHSNEPGALMYPWYQGYQNNFRLPTDDVEGIQKLYGYKGGPLLPPKRRSTPRPRRVDVTKPPTDVDRHTTLPPKVDFHPCDRSFDAIAVLRGEVFLFIGEYFWRQDNRGRLGEKTEIHTLWYGLPDNIDHIDAVFERPTDQKIVFFIGNRYWKFNSNSLVTNFPKEGRSITEFGIPPDIKKIDAVFTWGYNKATYLISGDMYWKFNAKLDHVEYDYPRDMGIWRNVKVPVDAAFRYWDGKTYFFKDDMYYRFYDQKMRVSKGFPKKIKHHWWGCGNHGSYDVQNIKEKKPDNGSQGLRLSPVSLMLSFIISLVCLWSNEISLHEVL